MSAETPQSGLLSGVALILVRPHYPENIGASARIAFNFGISQLIVVTDEEPDRERMLKMATHKAAHLIHNMQITATTAEAAAPFHFIVGTTTRLGRQRLREQMPREVMAKLVPLAQDGNIALMFGTESTGLQNEDLDLCQFSSTIPTADFSSLNLAQAVAIHCYELYLAFSMASSTPTPETDYANSFDLEGMYGHIERALTKITFMEDNNRTYWMRNLRQFFSRVRLRKKEASMIRGICRKFLWHSENPSGKNENHDL